MITRPAGTRRRAAGLIGLLVLGVCPPTWAWTLPAPVVATSEDSLDPRLSVDPDGNAHVVWRERINGGLFHIRYSTNLGGEFSGPVTISQGGSSGAGSPTVCATSPEEVHTAWIATVDDNFEIWYRKRTPTGWGAIFNASNTAIKSLRPTVAARGGFGPVIAWDEAVYADDNYDTFFSEWTGSGFSSAVNVSNTAGGAGYGSVNVNIVVASNGDLTAVWADRISGSYHVNARRRIGNIWQPRQELSALATGPATPGIAVTADNRVHVVYEAEGTIWYQFCDGSSWSAPLGLPGGLNSGIRPRLAVDESDVAHVVADAFTDAQNNRDIFYTNNLSGSFSGWSNVSSTPGTQSLVADIGYAANVITITWQDNKNGVYDVWHMTGPKPVNGPTGTLAGFVFDDEGVPLAGATVSVGGAYMVNTLGDGRYTISGIHVGTYTVSVTRPYYTAHTESDVAIIAGSTTNLNFTIAMVPPSPVAEFAAAPGNTVTVLSWTHPVNDNAVGTVVRATTTGYPESPDDGLLIADVAATPGSSAGVTHSGLDNGTTWFYAAFAYAGSAGRRYATAVNASATPAGPGDLDRDGDVDQVDFGLFQICLSGEFVPQAAAECGRTRLDGDDDVDGNDVMLFIGCLSGPGVAADPDCAD